ncbi:hypothetical protein F5148DRAFT_1163168 [Russula earlei]|uniref:Uncharacterized protein n=1 Tax=Russula earlei TaxID=71964 RepID=A0ACC0UL49_9AGAM|nr:hypothetical protein F5148DRAFT_1163168 [Russula earlei]
MRTSFFAIFCLAVGLGIAPTFAPQVPAGGNHMGSIFHLPPRVKDYGMGLISDVVFHDHAYHEELKNLPGHEPARELLAVADKHHRDTDQLRVDLAGWHHANPTWKGHEALNGLDGLRAEMKSLSDQAKWVLATANRRILRRSAF